MRLTRELSTKFGRERPNSAARTAAAEKASSIRSRMSVAGPNLSRSRARSIPMRDGMPDDWEDQQGLDPTARPMARSTGTATATRMSKSISIR